MKKVAKGLPSKIMAFFLVFIMTVGSFQVFGADFSQSSQNVVMGYSDDAQALETTNDVVVDAVMENVYEDFEADDESVAYEYATQAGSGLVLLQTVGNFQVFGEDIEQEVIIDYDYDENEIYEDENEVYEDNDALVDEDVEADDKAVAYGYAMPVSAQLRVISTPAQLVLFLIGQLGSNHDDFVLANNINMTGMGTFRGRGFVDGAPFTGSFDGSGFAITGLTLQPRAQMEQGATQGLNDVGLFRALGNGASIRNLTLANVVYTDPAAIADWNLVVGNVGLVAGRVMPGSVVNIDSVAVTGSSITFAGARNLSNKRVGGLIGFVEPAATLNISNVSVGAQSAGVTIALNLTGTGANRNVASAGGLVGRTAGTVNVLGGPNIVNVTTSIGSPGGSRYFQQAGGIIGTAVTPISASIRIENTEVYGRILASQVAGGFVGHVEGASLHITDSTNLAHLVVNGHAGGFVGRTTAGPGLSTNLTRVANHGNINGTGANSNIGGLVGQSRNTININNSVNFAPINLTSSGGASTVNAFGGIIGHASAIVSMTEVHNTAHVQQTGNGRSRGGGLIGYATNRVDMIDVSNSGNVGAPNTTTGGRLNSGLGGIIGYLRFSGTAANRVVNITDVTNTGNIGFNAAGGNAMRLRSGGIIGVSRNRSGVLGINITNVLNTGNVMANAVSGGIIGWNQSQRTTITGAINRGNVTVTIVGSNGCAGGIVGRSAQRDLTIFRAGNEGNVSAGTSGSSSDTGLSGVGGLIGSINRGTRNLVSESYNAGSITGGTATVGGLIGQIRRSGTTVIQDSYNIGPVFSRRGNHGTNASPRWTGNGILGHRGAAPVITMRRVFNAGNVQGRPIFGYSTTQVATRRMIYDQVFWDTSTYTGNQVQPATPGIQALPTSVFTSGHVQGISSGAWLVNGWLTPDGFISPNRSFESYPYLAWQTGGRYNTGFARGERQVPFYASITPGADYLTTGTGARVVNFSGVAQGTRLFNPYLARPAAGFANVQAGSSTINVTRAANQRMSVGLVSTNTVVGFGPNHMFEEPIVIAIDSTSGAMINHATFYQNGVRIPIQYYGIAAPDDIVLTDILTATALGYVMRPGWTFTQDDLNRGVVRILMDRVALDNVVVHIRNISVEADTPPFIATARNPQLDIRSHLPSSAFVPVPRGGTAAAPVFDISGAMWGDELWSRAIRFSSDLSELRFDMIRGGAGTPANPFVIWILLEDIDPGVLTMEIVRHEDADNEEGYVARRLPHGGRAGSSTHANPALSNNFTVEFRSPVGVDENPGALAGTGSGTGTTAAANQWNVTGATTLTEVRVIPNWGQTIGGLGNNLSYRTTGWHEIQAVWDSEETGPIFQIPVEPEIPVSVRVVEEFSILGQVWPRLIPAAVLDLEYDAGDGVDYMGNTIMRNHNIPGNNTGIFAARVVPGDMLLGSAPGFVPGYRQVDDSDVYTPGTPIYLPLARAADGIIHGFVLNNAMTLNPNVKLPIANANVTVFDEDGQVVATTVSDSTGYFFVSGLAPGNYTVFGAHATAGSNFAVPTPVVLTAFGNEQANIFLTPGQQEDFAILVTIREADSGTNITATASEVVLTFGSNSHTAAYITPFQTIRVNRNNHAAWSNGIITINIPGFSPMNVDVADFFSLPLGDFLLIEVEISLPINDLSVRVEDAEGNLISTATLYTARPEADITAHNDGTFTVDGVHIGDTLVAAATGFVTVNHPITNAEATAGLVVITLDQTVPVDITVYVKDSDSQLLPSAQLTQNSTAVAGNNDGTFYVSASVGDALVASAGGFNDVNRAVTYMDVANGYIIIHLGYGDGGGGYRVINNLVVEVRDTANQLLPSASLAVAPVGTSQVIRNNDGTFVVNGVFIHNVLTASAEGFVSVSHTITAHDAHTLLIVIRLGCEDVGGGGYYPIYNLIVNVVDEGGNPVVDASLTSNRAATQIINHNNGSFTLNHAFIHDVLTAQAVGFVVRDYTITAADAYVGEITIVLEVGVYVFFDVIDNYGGTLTVTAFQPDGTIRELTESGLAVPRGSYIHFMPFADAGYEVLRWFVSTPILALSESLSESPLSRAMDMWIRDIQVHTRVEVVFGHSSNIPGLPVFPWQTPGGQGQGQAEVEVETETDADADYDYDYDYGYDYDVAPEEDDADEYPCDEYEYDYEPEYDYDYGYDYEEAPEEEAPEEDAADEYPSYEYGCEYEADYGFDFPDLELEIEVESEVLYCNEA